MSFLRLRRPSPAMLVALLALVLAMTSTATAAVLISSPDQLASNVVTNSKLSTNAVNNRTLAPAAVNNAKLGTRAVDGRTLAGNAVGNFNLEDGAVSNSKLTPRAVDNTEMVNPVYSASINADGTVDKARSVGVDPSLTRKLGPGAITAGIYTVGFQKDVSNCAVAATATDTGVIANARTSSTASRTISVVLSRPVLATDTITALREDHSFRVIVQC